MSANGTPAGPARRVTPERLFIGLIGLVVLAGFSLIVLSLNRGFDWSDEAFVYDMIASNRVGTGEVWGFQHLLHGLYELLGANVLVFRVLRLIGYLALSVVLVGMARKALLAWGISLSRSSWVVILLVAQAGTFAAWSYPPRYLGYNELAAWFGQLGGAVLLYLLLTGRSGSSSRRERRTSMLLWGAVGIVGSLLFLAKFTGALALVALAIVVLFTSRAPIGRALRAASLVGGAAAGLLVLLATGVPLGTYLPRVAAVLFNPSAQEASGYTVVTLAIDYINSLSVTVTALAVPTILLTIIFVLSRGGGGTSLSLPIRVSLERVAFALAIIVALLLVLPRGGATWNDLGIGIAFTFMVAIIGFVVIGPPGVRLDGDRTFGPLQVGVALLVFFAAPFVSAVGTNNPIVGQTVFSATLWAVGAGVGVCVLVERSEALSRLTRFLPVLVLGAAVASSGAGVAADAFLHPYGTLAYFKQGTSTVVPALRDIRLSADQAETYDWLHGIAEREDAADVPTISIGMPGALLAFNASGWASPWITQYTYPSIARACAAELPSDLFVIQPEREKKGSVTFDGVVKALDSCGIAFPGDFELVDRRSNPDPVWSLSVWRLKD